MTLYWTRVLPRSGGWYWTRRANDGSDDAPEIRYVSFYGGRVSVEDADTSIDADEIEWWAGPIPLPVDLRWECDG